MADYLAPSTDGEPPVDLGAWGREWIALGGQPPEDPPPFDPGTLAAQLGSENAVVGALLDALNAVELPSDDLLVLAFVEEAS